MKILVLADEESKYLWDYFEKSKLEGIDLIISCGDLKPQYLSFLATSYSTEWETELLKNGSMMKSFFSVIDFLPGLPFDVSHC